MTIDLRQVVDFAKYIHAGDTRKYTGAPYTTHLARVAGQTMLLNNVTRSMIAAAWLHDSVEDHADKCNFKLIESLFGEETARYVECLTNTSKLYIPDRTRAQRKEWDRTRLATVGEGADAHILKIKLIDRMDNISELDLSKDGQAFADLYCTETMTLLYSLDFMEHRDEEFDTLMRLLKQKVMKTEELLNSIYSGTKA